MNPAVPNYPPKDAGYKPQTDTQRVLGRIGEARKKLVQSYKDNRKPAQNYGNVGQPIQSQRPEQRDYIDMNPRRYQ
jgi:hypothetical protein